MNSKLIKEFAVTLGADGCGIADIARFEGAPEGYHPKDIFSKCKSVVVFIKQMPTDAIFAENPVPYTHTAYKMYEEIDRIAMELCRFFQNNNNKALLIPADVPYLSWDQENMHGKGILSLKHAAVMAGLGIMGKNTIFMNASLGNMVYIGAVLIDKEVETDPMVEDFKCPENCRHCLDTCPQHAMNGITVNQKLCREHSFFKAGRGWDLYNCNQCRKVCPFRTGRKEGN
ncbi:MAG TPA: epoxyqueuosine reductase [Negativicutes bacterium]|jgi:epoxyqueuosine reductase QueG